MNTWILRVLTLTLAALYSFTPGVIPRLAGAEVTLTFPILETAHGAFTNVTVTTTNATEIHIRHDGGVESIALTNLNPSALRQLGFEKEAQQVEEALGMAEPAVRFDAESLRGFDPSIFFGGAALSAGLLAAVAAFALVLYVFSCYCYKRICLNAGHDPGILIWIPILQVIPLLQAAQMSLWWLIALLLPLLNFIAAIVWCFKIVSACGKSVVWAILLLLPGLNLIAFLYLAFSGPGGRPPSIPHAASG